MTCDTALELMSAALDGELTAEEQAQLDCHLAQCGSCRALFEDLTAIHHACGDWEAAPPPELREKILSNLPVQDRPGKVVSVHWGRWAAMAATFLFVSLAAWRLPGYFASKPATQAGDAAIFAAPTQAEETFPRAEEPGEAAEPSAEAPVPEPASTPLPNYVSGEGVDVNAAQPSAPELTAVDRAAKYAATSTAGAAPSAARSAAQEDLSLSTFGIAAADEFDAAANELPMMASARVFASPAPENGLAFAADGGSVDDPTIEKLEPLPDIAEEENVLVELPPSSSLEEAAPAYCGVLTLSGGALLSDYPSQVRPNGETWYELSDLAFYALVEELTANGADFALRSTGADVSATAPTGLVVILP